MKTLIQINKEIENYYTSKDFGNKSLLSFLLTQRNVIFVYPKDEAQRILDTTRRVLERLKISLDGRPMSKDTLKIYKAEIKLLKERIKVFEEVLSH